MQQKFPRLFEMDDKRSSHIINRHNRMHKLILKRYDCPNHTLLLPDLALHQLIAMSAHNLTVLPKKKPLCDIVPIDMQRPHPSTCNKKVLIFKQAELDEKENKFSDLKTCKSLLNPKISTLRKAVPIFNNKKQRVRYNTQSIHSLWDITDRNVTDALKVVKNEDFELRPWGSD